MFNTARSALALPQAAGRLLRAKRDTVARPALARWSFATSGAGERSSLRGAGGQRPPAASQRQPAWRRAASLRRGFDAWRSGVLRSSGEGASAARGWAQHVMGPGPATASTIASSHGDAAAAASAWSTSCGVGVLAPDTPLSYTTTSSSEDDDGGRASEGEQASHAVIVPPQMGVLARAADAQPAQAESAPVPAPAPPPPTRDAGGAAEAVIEAEGAPQAQAQVHRTPVAAAEPTSSSPAAGAAMTTAAAAAAAAASRGDDDEHSGGDGAAGLGGVTAMQMMHGSQMEQGAELGAPQQGASAGSGSEGEALGTEGEAAVGSYAQRIALLRAQRDAYIAEHGFVDAARVQAFQERLTELEAHSSWHRPRLAMRAAAAAASLPRRRAAAINASALRRRTMALEAFGAGGDDATGAGSAESAAAQGNGGAAAAAPRDAGGRAAAFEVMI